MYIYTYMRLFHIPNRLFSEIIMYQTTRVSLLNFAIWEKKIFISMMGDPLFFLIMSHVRDSACTNVIFNNYSPKAKWIFTNSHEPEANNCFSIITQVIIEIPKQRNVTILPQFAIVYKNSYNAACINVSRNAFLNIFFDIHIG